MKIFVLLSCLLAVATASYNPYIGYGQGYGYGGYPGPQHLPVIGPQGVPLEPPANVAARAQHAVAVDEAKARNGDYGYGGYAGAYGYATPAFAYGGYAHGGYGYAAHGTPVIGPAGVPLELPANVAARAQHAAAYAQTKARDYSYSGAYLASPALGYGHGLYGAQHLPVIGPHGVPLEPPANVAARLQHAAAHAEAKSRTGYYGHLYGRKRRSIYGGYYPGPQHIPVIGSNGVPLEPPANVAARVAHAAAHAAAASRAYAGPVAAYGGFGAYGGYGAYGSYGGYGYAPISPLGEVQDTPEVAHAKVAHFAAVAEAKARVGLGPYAGAYASAYGSPYGYSPLSHSGLPVDTPAVAAAKVAHLAAHAAVAAHGGHY